MNQCYDDHIYHPQTKLWKVMFPQSYVKNSVHRVGDGQTPPPQQTATAADGTHPTGMHSSIFIDLTRMEQLSCRICLH